MKVLYIASEALPFIASGGLADVAGSLPKALAKKGVECRVVLPLYSDIRPELRDKMTPLVSYYVNVSWRNQYCGVYEAQSDGITYYLLDNEYYFKRKGTYGFYDDAERFAFFSMASLELVKHLDYTPDILHCNDWQTALVPVFLNLFFRCFEKLRSIKTVFTIHNIQYQGRFGMEICGDLLGLPRHKEGIVEFDGCANYMKAAIDQSDRITTVSPTYAKEILDPWYAHGLDGLLRERQYKLSGILNGIDTDLYNPQTDPSIEASFSASQPAGKAEDKAALQRLLHLPESPQAMVMSMVTRLVSHKGLDLVKYIFGEILRSNIQVVVLGSGESGYEQFFTEMQRQYPEQVAVRLGFLPDLARKIYAGLRRLSHALQNRALRSVPDGGAAVRSPAHCPGDRRPQGLHHRLGRRGGQRFHLQDLQRPRHALGHPEGLQSLRGQGAVEQRCPHSPLLRLQLGSLRRTVSGPLPGSAESVKGGKNRAAPVETVKHGPSFLLEAVEKRAAACQAADVSKDVKAGETLSKLQICLGV